MAELNFDDTDRMNIEATINMKGLQKSHETPAEFYDNAPFDVIHEAVSHLLEEYEPYSGRH